AAIQRQPSLAFTPRQADVRKRVLPLDHELLPSVENLSRHWRSELNRVIALSIQLCRNESKCQQKQYYDESTNFHFSTPLFPVGGLALCLSPKQAKNPTGKYPPPDHFVTPPFLQTFPITIEPLSKILSLLFCNQFSSPI